MNDTIDDTSTLDDFERDLVRTLQVKADQLVVDEAPFRPDAPAPMRRSLAEHTPVVGRSRRARHRWLAAAAVAAVLLGGLAVVQRLLPADDPDVAMPSAPVMWSTMPDEGTAAFVATAPPERSTLAQIRAGSMPAEGPATWQLFAVDGVSPLPRGVLVGSRTQEDRVLGGEPTHTVQGQPARLGQSGDPLVPAGALELHWADGDVFHDVVAVGVTEAELLGFLESLAPRDDPAAGFDARSDAAFPELEAATIESQSYSSSVGYVGPSGPDGASVVATSADSRGRLLHRLVGTPYQGDGYVIRGGGESYEFASVARADGWTVEVSVRPVRRQPVGAEAVLDAVLDSVEPVTQQQLVDLGVAQPVTATETVGDWTVEVHGNHLTTLALCLTRGAGEQVCTTAQGIPATASPPAGDVIPEEAGLTTGSVLVDGEWVVVALTDGTEPATIETAPTGSDPSPEGYSPETLQGERRQSGDHVVEVLTVPADVEAVSVVVPRSDRTATGTGYHRPAG